MGIEPDALEFLEGHMNIEEDPSYLMDLLISQKLEADSDLKTVNKNDLVLHVGNKAKDEALTQVSSPLSSMENLPEFEILHDPSDSLSSSDVDDFHSLFKDRYEKLVKILKQRPGSVGLLKISELGKVKGRTKVSGLVVSKKSSSLGHEVTIDDDTGRVTFLLSTEGSLSLADRVVLDECLMVDVEKKGDRLYAKEVVQPDIPMKVFSASRTPIYAVLTSDLHVGSARFLPHLFDKFVSWLAGSGMVSDNDKEILKRVAYVVIAGDVIDGVGIYPGQELELVEKFVYKQYELVAEALSRIPKHLKLLIAPGNHDSTRQSLPQPRIPEEYAQDLCSFENVTMLGGPCLVKLSGAKVLIYHGRSLDDVLATTPGLSYERPSEAMRVLLKARHLAPTFGLRTPIAPAVADELVINEVPDVFHSGHVHTVGFEEYRGTLLINSGTWQAQTRYQSNLGITPRVGLVPIVDLASLSVIFKDFTEGGVAA